MVKINLWHKYLFIIVVYIAPSCSAPDYISLFENLMSINTLYDSQLLIVGDFNIPEYHNCFSSNIIHTNIYCACDNFCKFFGLHQKNFVFNSYERLLDLAFSNFDCQVSRATEILTAEDKLHPALEINSSMTRKRLAYIPPKNAGEFNFKKADFPSLYRSICETDFSFLNFANDVNVAVDLLYNKLNDIFNNFVPMKKQPTRNYPPWFNKEIIVNLKQKQKAWINHKNSQTPDSLQIFKEQRTKVKNLIRSAHKLYLKRITDEIRDNPKQFWSYLKNKNKQSGIPNIMNYKNTEINTPQEIVNAFADLFGKSYTHCTSGNSICSSVTDLDDLYKNTLYLKKFDKSEIHAACMQLKPTLTAGPDGVPSFFIRDCASILCDPLLKIFNLILKRSVFPEKWKLSRITPVHKKDSSSDVTNYRPITIINNFAKIFEIALHSRMYRHVFTHLSSAQHGFVKGRSTTTNLLLKTQFIADCLDERGQVDCIYTDYSKAFDCINHTILLHKLHSFGCSIDLVNLFSSYLCGRYQYVYCHGFKSVNFLQSSGVPQGSVLGPLLFNIYINDVVTQFDVKHLIYADDLKLFCSITTINDCIRLQDNINRLFNWSNRNELLVNKKKCFVKSFYRKLNPIAYDYNIDGFVLQRPEHICDLGVTFDTKLRFDKHIEVITSKAYKSLGLVIRNSSFIKEKDILQLLFYTYVRSRLEYSSLVWYPIYQVDISSLEKIQRRFLKFLCFTNDGAYPPQGFPNDLLLRRFHIQSLSCRRYVTSIIMLYNLIHGRVKCDDLLLLLNFRAPTINLRCNSVFQIPIPRTNVMRSSPLYQMLNNYTIIETDVDIFCCSVKNIRRFFAL